MGKLLYLFNKLHKKTARKYIDRMVDDKIKCMSKAKEYEFDYWDGDRRYGYGGYKYDGRWKEIALDLVNEYNLKDGCSILDVGCGKAFLLYELKQLLPNAKISGFDISKHGIADAKVEIKENLFIHKAEENYPFEDREFDLVISLGTLHNLKIYDLKKALGEIERVGKNKFVMVEAYRNDTELFNLECWALTCESFFRPDEWTWLYDQFGYTGDYEFIYFE
jgi:ubiquinone/menaquinone biosynthesis C-methylase UbiE